jgi:quercetin dioxygenase-like cupin family protein
MISKTVSHFIESANAAWKRSKIPGVQYLALRSDEAERSGTFLLKLAPKTNYPRHRHPAGEEILVLKGDMTIGERTLKGGDFLFSPPGSVHEASTVGGCLFLTMIPKPIEMLASSSQEEYDETKATQDITPSPSNATAQDWNLIDLPEEPPASDPNK